MDLEKQLTTLWEQKRGVNTVRACLFTLVVYTLDAKRAHYFKELVHSINQRFPCRVVMVHGTLDSKESFLDVSASVEEIKQGDLAVASDKVVINVSCDCLSQVPFIVLPVLVPDLPVYLLWGEDPTSDSLILPKLKNFATRLIFDPSCTSNIKRFGQKILHEVTHMGLEIMDMNWAFIARWRDVTAQVFDCKERFDELLTAKKIQVVYNNHTSLSHENNNDTLALYYQAWLAAMLGFELCGCVIENAEQNLLYKRGDQDLVITLVARDYEKAPSSTIMSVDIATSLDTYYHLESDAEKPFVTVNVSSKEKCDLPFSLPLANIKRPSLLIQEMFYHPISEHYEKTLKVLAQDKTTVKGDSNARR